MKKREVLRQDHDDLVSYSIEPITGPACGVESFIIISISAHYYYNDQWQTRGKRNFLINNIKNLSREKKGCGICSLHLYTKAISIYLSGKRVEKSTMEKCI